MSTLLKACFTYFAFTLLNSSYAVPTASKFPLEMWNQVASNLFGDYKSLDSMSRVWGKSDAARIMTVHKACDSVKATWESFSSLHENDESILKMFFDPRVLVLGKYENLDVCLQTFSKHRMFFKGILMVEFDFLDEENLHVISPFLEAIQGLQVLNCGKHCFQWLTDNLSQSLETLAVSSEAQYRELGNATAMLLLASKKLRKFDISSDNSKQVLEALLENGLLTSKNSSLISLRLHNNVLGIPIGFEPLVALSDLSQELNLEELSLSNQEIVDLGPLIPLIQRVKHFALDKQAKLFNRLGNETIEAFYNATGSLETLKLSGCGLQDDLISRLISPNSIKSLDLSRNLLHSNAFDSILRQFPNLISINLSGNLMTELPVIVNSTKLEKVAVSFNKFNETESLVNFLDQSPQIKHLELEGIFPTGSLPSTLLEALSNMPQLESLDLSQNFLSKEDIRQIAESKGFRELKALSLENCKLGKESLSIIQSSKTLTAKIDIY